MAISKIILCCVLLLLGHLSVCMTDDADDNRVPETENAAPSSTTKPGGDSGEDNVLKKRPLLLARPLLTTTMASPLNRPARIPPRQPRILTTAGERNDDGVRPAVTPGNNMLRAAFNRRASHLMTSNTTMHTNSSSSQQDSFLSDIIKKLKHAFGKMSTRYPPGHKMFRNTSEFVQRISRRKTRLLTDLQNCKVRGSPAFNLSRVSESDVRRILDDMESTPVSFKDKLTSEGGLHTLSSDDLCRMPVSILPALTEQKVTEFNGLPEDRLKILCDRLMATGASPWGLLSTVESGINCLDRSTLNYQINSSRHLSKDPAVRAPGYAVSKVMMTYTRETQTPDTWNSKSFIETAKRLTGAITAEDLKKVPDTVLRQSIKNISTIEFPFKSQTRTMVDRASSVFGTPTSWPESFILDTGRLLEGYKISKVALLRNNALFNIADDLDKSGIKKDLTRLVLADGIHQEFKTRSNKNNIAIMIPWLKGEVEFIESLDLHSIVNTFKTNSFSHVPFTTAEKYMITSKVEQFLKTTDFGNNTDEYLLGFDDILEGFSREFLQFLPEELIQNFTKAVPFKQISKARLMVRRLKKFLGKETLSAKEVGTLFNGLNTSDVDRMSNAELEDMLPLLRSMDLPSHLGSIIVKKLGRSLLQENKTGCNMAFRKLGKLAVHLSPQLLEEEKYIPIPIEENFMEDCPQTDIQLKKSQAIAVVDNIREELMNRSGGEVFNANILHRLGRFSEGLSVKDIETLPFDTEMLSIIEVMSNFEDELSSAQVEAITDKIRKYFDIKNRNEITEASDITVAQIGRFLQYLHPKFELLKFPKAVRPSISREIGKSSLLKVSNSQRQELLLFALKNAPAGNGSTTDLLLKQMIQNEDIEDLGSLRCGLTVGVITKLSNDAITTNMEDFNNCPMKEEIFEALLKKAVDLNINCLKVREGIGSIGSMIQYVRDVDSQFINKREMSSIASYLATAMNQLDSVFKKSIKNGFVLENNSHIKGMHKERRKHQANKLYTAMIETQKQEHCYTMLLMGPLLPDVLSSINTDVTECLEAIGTLPNWERADARKMLEKTLDQFGKGIDKQTLTAMDEDMIIQTSGLLKGLTTEEIRHLKLNDINSLALIGSKEFSNEQLHEGFENWRSSQTVNSAIGEEELLFMQNFACGMSPSVIENSVSGSTVKNCLGSLGHRRCFKQNQTEALAIKLVQSMPSSPVSEWKDHIILEMGHLIGGLQKSMFQDLTKYQVQVIEPEVITAFSPEKVQDFTVEQLAALSPNQAAAFTTMQRSFMTEEQMAAIGKGALNGANHTAMTSFTMVVLVLLSLMRQIVVHL